MVRFSRIFVFGCAFAVSAIISTLVIAAERGAPKNIFDDDAGWQSATDDANPANDMPRGSDAAATGASSTPAPEVRPATIAVAPAKVIVDVPPMTNRDSVLPVPDAAAVDAAVIQVKATFKTEYKAVGSARIGLAQTLLKSGGEATDPVTQFALFREARDIAANAGDARTGLVAARRIASNFSVDLTGMGLDVLMAASRGGTGAEHAADAATVAMTLLDRAIENHQFDLAIRVAGIAEGSARLMRATALLSNLQSIEKDLHTRMANEAKIAAAKEKIATTPGDPEANLTLGRDLCFEHGNWDEGLPYLVKGSDAILKNIATKDLKAPTDIAGQSEVATLWWTTAQNQALTTKLRMQERSAYWYGLAAPKLVGAKSEEAKGRIRFARDVLPPVVMMRVPVMAKARRPASGGGGASLGGDVAESVVLDGTKPYTINKLLRAKENGPSVEIKVTPGVEIRDGAIYLDTHGHLKIQGTAEKPAVLRNVQISMDNGSSLEAEFAVFDGCTFSKGGVWFSYNSTHWTFRNCLLYKSSFTALDGTDYGVQLEKCRLIAMTFPEMTHKREAGKAYNHLDQLRTDWDRIRACEFVECAMPPTITWCAEDSNFLGCKFMPGEAYEGAAMFEWRAFLSGTSGPKPQAVFDAKPGARGKVKVVTMSAPSLLPMMGEKLIPELTFVTKALATDK